MRHVRAASVDRHPEDLFRDDDRVQLRLNSEYLNHYQVSPCFFIKLFIKNSGIESDYFF